MQEIKDAIMVNTQAIAKLKEQIGQLIIQFESESECYTAEHQLDSITQY
jgi:sensor histidine kinase regulating citrate/malate metabolism